VDCAGKGWETDPDTYEEAIDFRRVGFQQANLKGTDWTGANHSDASIDETNFTSADFTLANLSGAAIGDANFTSAVLTVANLSGANIINADFTSANATAANLSGATIAGNFKKANLAQARLDSTTLLGSATNSAEDYRVQMDAETRLLDVAWSGAILANVTWEQVPRLGDEANIKAATSRKERVQVLRDAARAYRGLAKALQAQGLTIPALKYRTREQQLERRALLYSFAFGPWLFSWLLNLVSGYGDKPGRALGCYLGVVSFFAATYFAITNQLLGVIASHSTHLQWYEALVLSISSFHGRGFFPTMLSLGDPVAIVAAAEAVTGLFIELVFIATFTQRFFAR
jgi:uncharacterized protein YjbI with pentapeptide repeats